MELRRICEELCTPECTPTELNMIKCHFRQQIKSERLMDKIDSLRLLIKVLKRRSIINDENIQALNEIAHLLKRRITNNIPIEDQHDNNNFNHQFVNVDIPRNDFNLNTSNRRGK